MSILIDNHLLSRFLKYDFKKHKLFRVSGASRHLILDWNKPAHEKARSDSTLVGLIDVNASYNLARLLGLTLWT